MPEYHSAFLAGERVRLADSATLENLQRKFSYHDLTPRGMVAHAGELVRIKAISYFHLGTVLYEFDEIGGHWLEAALIDPCFDSDAARTHPIYIPAHEIYSAHTDTTSGPGLVHIKDESGTIYCSMHRLDVKRGASDINEVARIRARAAFEHRYNFEGMYES